MKANAQIVETGVLRGEKFILEGTIPNPPKVGASQKNRQLLTAGSDRRVGPPAQAQWVTVTSYQVVTGFPNENPHPSASF